LTRFRGGLNSTTRAQATGERRAIKLARGRSIEITPSLRELSPRTSSQLWSDINHDRYNPQVCARRIFKIRFTCWHVERFAAIWGS
jgi:hypothetical protein